MSTVIPTEPSFFSEISKPHQPFSILSYSPKAFSLIFPSRLLVIYFPHDPRKEVRLGIGCRFWIIIHPKMDLIREDPTTADTFRRVCSTSNSSETSLDDHYGGSDCDRVPLLTGTTHPIDNCVKIDLSQPDNLIKISPSIYDKYPNEPRKALIALGMLVVAAFCNDIVLSYVHERVPQQPPLPDFVFTHTPYMPWTIIISEYLMLTSFVFMVLLTLMHRHRWIVFRRITFIASLLYFGRCLTMFVTQVPVADPNFVCAPRLATENSTMWNITLRALRIVSGLGLKLTGNNSLCGDYIYSGHTVVLVTSSLFIQEYSPRRWKLLHLLSTFVSTVGVLLLLISRGHYTVDVIISYWISTRVFWIYHTMAAYPSLKDRTSNHNHLSKIIWFRLFHYMECNVHKPVPRKFDWPFSMLVWRKHPVLSARKSNKL
ncbi:hypothetical protein AB6A40_003230 [Gnathostoma spinigerum]|uniref:Sphingomyelin synthase-like domain-containing protein n=1 Tax=Gnathostoma spinigerum TaxID=75299 RepID=A0ABD6EA70_9BILA